MALFSLEEVKKAHEDKREGHFFTPQTLRYWLSRISSKVFPTPHGAVFVTSERDRMGGPRAYTTRYINEDSGEITTLGMFREFKSRGGALAAAKRRAKNIADFIEEEREQQA